jgi:hypothetical protein
LCGGRLVGPKKERRNKAVAPLWHGPFARPSDPI